MDLPDVDQLTWPGKSVGTRRTPRPQPARQRQIAPFVKGPIPLHWVAHAARLSGKAMQVGVMLWYRCGLTQSLTTTLPTALLQLFDIDRHAVYRALTQLENAGLITVSRYIGRKPIVTIVEIPTHTAPTQGITRSEHTKDTQCTQPTHYSTQPTNYREQSDTNAG